MTFYADLIALLHAGIALFVLGGVAAISLGALYKWSWTENRAFRITHLTILLFITTRALLNIPCPLSVWEDSFAAHPHLTALHWLAFRGVDPTLFTPACIVLTLSTSLLTLPHVEKRTG
jgi:hypothetical protein